MSLSRMIIPGNEDDFNLLRYLTGNENFFTVMESIAIAALFCQHAEHLNFFITRALLPGFLEAYSDYEAMGTLKDYDPKFVVRSAHARLDAQRYRLIAMWEYTCATDSAQGMLQGLCMYLHAFFEQKELHVGPEYRWDLCMALHDDTRAKLLDSEYGLDFLVPERLDGIRETVFELEQLASDRNGVNKILERAANAEWIMNEAERMWANQLQSEGSVSRSLGSQGMSLEQAHEYLQSRLEYWEEDIRQYENTRST
ncbi:hypothetical protein DPV78_010955 [Talaromyces pinophilus]|nr:hypothetical protein DPV78_010955 [Talaromyces pinophilus]